jgi:tetrahydromethanopterin:alpha-L-glutamate ligase
MAFANRGYSSEYISLTDCRLQLANNTLPVFIPGYEQSLPDAVFVRGVPGGSLEEVVFYLDILHALKLAGIPVYNHASAIEHSVDKGMTSFLLKQSGLPTPPTWVMRDRSAALMVAEQELRVGNLLISKPLFGSQGEGIRRIEKMTDLFWMPSSNGIYYIQRFIHCAGDGYSDTRVFVINGQAITAMRRYGQSWLNNVARGARCESTVLTEKMADLSVRAADALDMDYAGVDLIEDKHGNLQIIEVNSIPAWKGLQGVCELNVAECLAEDLITRYLRGSSNAIAMTAS